MTSTPPPVIGPTIDEQPWPEIELPPTDLPYDDGDKMESPWHAENSFLLKASYVAFRGGYMDTFFVGVNMFVYYSTQQVRNRDYKGPDVFIVKDVDGTRDRLSWIVWAEDGRYPDVIFELLSSSTEEADLGSKQRLYERVFHTAEYFCIAPDVERLLGWRLERSSYVPIQPDERGWLWSAELGLWLGAWRGLFLGHERTWARFYTADGALVLLPDEAEHERAEAERQRAEAEHERAEAERQRADELADRLAALEAELKRLRGGTANG